MNRPGFHPDLRDLLRRSRRGDEAAARALLAACAPSMRVYARAILRDHALAEDAVQAALLAVFDAPIRRIDAIEDAHAWLMTVTRRKASGMARSRARAAARERRSALSAHASFKGQAPDESESVRDAIAGLPRRWREAVVLTEACGMTLEQAAQAMRANRNTVAWWKRRGLERLRTILTHTTRADRTPATEASHG